MDEDTIVLWKAQLSGHVPNKDIPLSIVHGAISGAPLHKDLGELIKACQEIGRAYSIAKIECKPSDVEQYPGLPEGWYKARRDITTSEEFVPIDQVREVYGAYLQ